MHIKNDDVIGLSKPHQGNPQQRSAAKIKCILCFPLYNFFYLFFAQVRPKIGHVNDRQLNACCRINNLKRRTV